MKLKLEKVSELVRGIEIISELVTEVRIKVSEFGMNITAMDPANVSLIGYSLPKEAFTLFEAEDETLGVNLDELKSILKRCGTKSAITLERRENFLDITIEDKVRRNFSLGLIDVERDEIDFKQKTERMEFVSRVEMDSSDLIASIEDCAVVSDSCSFETKEGKFIIFAKGTNSARSEVCDEADISGEDSRAKYSLEYLQKFLKGVKLCQKTVLKFSTDHPLMVEIKSEHMKLNFVLAPRVETDD